MDKSGQVVEWWSGRWGEQHVNGRGQVKLPGLSFPYHHGLSCGSYFGVLFCVVAPRCGF